MYGLQMNLPTGQQPVRDGDHEMDLSKPLLRLLGLASKVGRTLIHRDRRPMKEPEPLALSASQREQVEKRIAKFIEDSASIYAHAHGAIARVNALPLFFDWTGFMALGLDGQIAWIPYDDEPDEVEVVKEELLRNLGLFQGTRLHPELSFLMPLRPPNAIDCPGCRGTGKVAFPKGSEHLAEKVLCSCGGIGWIPPDGNW
jgi:hypothetical protein